MNWYITCWKKYVKFSGRARRQEFFMYYLFNVLFMFLTAMLDGLLRTVFEDYTYYVIYSIYVLAAFLPTLAVIVRRLHDSGKSGVWALTVFIPLVGPLVLLLFLCKEGDSGENQYGVDPKSE